MQIRESWDDVNLCGMGPALIDAQLFNSFDILYMLTYKNNMFPRNNRSKRFDF